jgi:hypothetical protein
LGCASCRKLLTMNCVIHRGLLRYVCGVKLWCMLLANWNCVYHLVCLECRKCTSKCKCERRIVTTLVWGSAVGWLPAEMMVSCCYTCRGVYQMYRLAQHKGER